MKDMITQIQAYIAADWYIRREARYDVKAIARFLTNTYPGMALDAIDGDALWEAMQANVICRHDAVASGFYVHLEDLESIAEDRDSAKLPPIECASCDAWFAHDIRTWVIR
jgi:hypothetical protein